MVKKLFFFCALVATSTGLLALKSPRATHASDCLCNKIDEMTFITQRDHECIYVPKMTRWAHCTYREKGKKTRLIDSQKHEDELACPREIPPIHHIHRMRNDEESWHDIDMHRHMIWAKGPIKVVAIPRGCTVERESV